MPKTLSSSLTKKPCMFCTITEHRTSPKKKTKKNYKSRNRRTLSGHGINQYQTPCESVATPLEIQLQLGSLLNPLPRPAFSLALALAAFLGATRLLMVLAICRLSCPLFSGGLFSFEPKLPPPPCWYWQEQHSKAGLPDRLPLFSLPFSCSCSCERSVLEPDALL